MHRAIELPFINQAIRIHLVHLFPRCYFTYFLLATL